MAVMLAIGSWSGTTYASSAGLMAGLMQGNATTTPTTTPKTQGEVDDAVDSAGELVMNGADVPIDLMDLFDFAPGVTPSGDQFEAQSSDPSVVEASISDNPHVVLTPRMPGMAQITVTHMSTDAMVMFDVQVQEMATPVLPLVGSGLLGLLLFAVGAWRRYRSA